jgi:hypothetical protein
VLFLQTFAVGPVVNRENRKSKFSRQTFYRSVPYNCPDFPPLKKSGTHDFTKKIPENDEIFK